MPTQVEIRRSVIKQCVLRGEDKQSQENLAKTRLLPTERGKMIWIPGNLLWRNSHLTWKGSSVAGTKSHFCVPRSQTYHIFWYVWKKWEKIRCGFGLSFLRSGFLPENREKTLTSGSRRPSLPGPYLRGGAERRGTQRPSLHSHYSAASAATHRAPLAQTSAVNEESKHCVAL